MANNDLLVQSGYQNLQVQAEANQQRVSKQEPVNVVPEAEAEVEAKQEGVVSALTQEQQQENKEALQEKVAQLNEHMQSLNRSLQFSIDEVSGETIVKVIDAETKELVRQIPSQEVIDARNAVEQYRGILLKTKV